MMTQKTDLFNQNSREAAKIAKKANLFKGQQKKIVCAYFKGKRVMKPLKNTMQMDVDLAVEIHLADKIIVDILMRLPVRSLLRFKCVSKFWRTLISDPYFKMKHLIHARNNQNSQKLLISQFYLGMDHSFSFYCSSLLVKDVQKLDCPLNIEQVILRIFCCYDGLSIVGAGDCSSEEFKFFLWNPSTRESIELPVPDLLPRAGYCTWGLGYDSASDDYKILKIDKEVHSEILALKSGSWETIYRHPPGISFVAWGTESLSFLHGAFHWLGKRKSLNYSVVSFSISNKVYGEIPLPDQMFLICDADEMEYGVSVLRGMLCCYSTSYILRKDGTFKLWVLKDYGVKESWYQMAIITCTGLSQCRPKYWIAEHEFLLFSRYGGDGGDSGFVFGTSNEPFGLQPRIEAFREGFVYTESLIFPRLST